MSNPSPTGTYVRLRDGRVVVSDENIEISAIASGWRCMKDECFSNPDDLCPCGRFYVDDDVVTVKVRDDLIVASDDSVCFGGANQARATAALLIRAADEMDDARARRLQSEGAP